MYTQAPPPRRKSNVLAVAVGIAVATVALLCGLGACLAGAPPAEPRPTGVESSATKASSAPSPDSPTTSPATTQGPSPVIPTLPPVEDAKKAPVKIQGDDIVHVGEDVPPGTYRVTERVGAGENCYWKKSTDSEGSDIIDNDIVNGGRPQVTLKKGQWFETSRCPTWVKK